MMSVKGRNRNYGNREETKKCTDRSRAYPGEGCRENRCFQPDYFQLGKSYPDIISVIALSDLYSVSLDELLKGDQKMAEHLEESTNVVKSNKKLTGAILLNIILMILLIALNMLLPEGTYYLVIVFCVVIMSSSALLYQIIKRI